jgi:hypothetical protein
MLTPFGLQAEIGLRDSIISAHEISKTVVEEDHFGILKRDA